MREKNKKNGDTKDAERQSLDTSVDMAGRASPAEAASLRNAGLLFVVADLLWILQAALIAYALGFLPGFATAQETIGEYARQVLLYPALLAAVGVILIAAIRSVLQARALNASRRIARGIETRTRENLLMSAAKGSPAAPFPSAGAFASHVTEQVELLGPYYRSFGLQSVRLRIVPIAIVLVTAWVSWLAALILLVAGPVIPLFMALIGMRAKSASADQQEELTRLSGALLDRIRGLETLRLFGAVQRTATDMARAGDRFRESTMKVLRIAFLSSTVLELFSALGIAFCAVYVGFSLLGDITIGTWGAPLSFTGGLFVLLLAPEFFAPLRAYAGAYHDRAAGIAAQEKLALIAGEISRSVNSGDLAASERSKSATGFTTPPEISFSDVGLRLGGRQVFLGLNLVVDPGETVFLSGPSGCGKTTVLDCILGFHAPQSGSVLVGGQPICDTAAALRENVMWLGQEPRLFHGTVRHNLLKGLPPTTTVSDDAFWQSLQIAGAADLVRRLPRGLSTQIGEDGFGLSVGEIRRLALARAAMRRDAKLLLADEPTASLDAETAADVIRGLEQLATGRTVLIATHDAEVLQMSGRRFVMTRPERALTEGLPA
ncbi:thiol reductant ABC exporter subunit CydD [Roseibium sp.]|uniref:thiol reductant ABC exporter subunit CydD n=1 Tax=Roseibium sp. TaxID=1936156 RepID=UPI0025D83790|nr:thiol reductant ABC exporter subunit CydD [Roseibium sp.]